ncbi:MAG: hypothetical protein ABI999_16990 [Acidobacteriota bacterium]
MKEELGSSMKSIPKSRRRSIAHIVADIFGGNEGCVMTINKPASFDKNS